MSSHLNGTRIDRSRMKSLIDGFPEVKVLVLGDIMLDRYLRGNVERISPEAPVPVVSVNDETVRLGGAANVAANVTSLGAQVRLLGVVGEDRFAGQLREALRENGMDESGLVTDPSRRTTVKTRIVAGSQQVVRIDRENTDEISSEIVADLISSVEETIEELDGIIISDYGKGVITLGLLTKLISMAAEKSKFIAVDPKEVHFKNYRGVSVITPNHHEAGFVSGRRIADEAILEQVGRQLLVELELESLLITRGEKGMTLFEKDGAKTDIEAEARTVFDVTGAGDTVIASLTVAKSSGATMKEAAFISNMAAGLAVGRFGTARISREDLLKAIDNRQ